MNFKAWIHAVVVSALLLSGGPVPALATQAEALPEHPEQHDCPRHDKQAQHESQQHSEQAPFGIASDCCDQPSCSCGCAVISFLLLNLPTSWPTRLARQDWSDPPLADRPVSESRLFRPPIL